MNDLITQNAIYAALVLAACMLVNIVKHERGLRRNIKRIDTLVSAAEADNALDLAIQQRVTAYNVERNALRYNGELYLRNADKAISTYMHTGTGKAYYKIGLQFRDAITGRIVSEAAALAGA